MALAPSIIVLVVAEGMGGLPFAETDTSDPPKVPAGTVLPGVKR
jgi:hypothetical protein